jgi:hypothetical protein
MDNLPDRRKRQPVADNAFSDRRFVERRDEEDGAEASSRLRSRMREKKTSASRSPTSPTEAVTE